MGKVSVRYIVADVDAAIGFYTEMLGFTVETHPAPGFASLARGDLRLLLNRPGAGGAGRVMPDRQAPVPGGWNRIQLAVERSGPLLTASRRWLSPFGTSIAVINQRCVARS